MVILLYDYMIISLLQLLTTILILLNIYTYIESSQLQ